VEIADALTEAVRCGRGPPLVVIQMAYDLCWVSSRHYQLRYVSGYHAAGSDHASSTDVNALKYQRVHSNKNVILDGDRNGYPGVRAVSPKFWRQWMEVRVHDDDICSNRDPGSDVDCRCSYDGRSGETVRLPMQILAWELRVANTTGWLGTIGLELREDLSCTPCPSSMWLPRHRWTIGIP
jgi:hypothetical protein